MSIEPLQGIHYLHPAELSKQARMEEESRIKGVTLDDHPGRRMWLCKPCGTWHPTEQLPTTEPSMPLLAVTDGRKPCPHCGDLMNEDPEYGRHCNTIGCAGFKPEAWPEGSIGRAAIERATGERA
jgi:hypothetical protein